jgi:hypothetical protein
MKRKKKTIFFSRIILIIFIFLNITKWCICFTFNSNEKATESLFILPLTFYNNTEIPLNQPQFLYLRYTQQIQIKECHNTTHTHNVALQWYLFCKLSKSFQWVSLTLTQGQWRDYFSSIFFPPGEKEDNGAEIELVLKNPYSKT